MKPNISDAYASKGMRYPAINDLIAKASNKYELCLATSKRAREIIDGDEPLVKITIDNPVSIATMEIAEDMVKPVNRIAEAGPELVAGEVSFPEDARVSDAMTTADFADDILE